MLRLTCLTPREPLPGSVVEVSMRRRTFLQAATCALLLPGLPRSARAASRRVVLLQPLGKSVPAEALRSVDRALAAVYGFEVRVADPVSLPPFAWTEERRRWRAERILAFLESTQPGSAHRTLGVTTEDISTTKPPHRDWGVIGLGTIGGPTAVVSAFRTTKGVSAAVARVRLAKMAVHEVGHTLGLEHCPTSGCLMQDAQGTIRTADASSDLCDSCRTRLAFAGYELPTFAGASHWR